MNLYSLSVVFGLLILFLLAPTLEYELKLRRRARVDYAKARGTIHRQILKSYLLNLDQELSRLEAKEQSLLLRRIKLGDEKKRELDIALTEQLANEQLEQLPGIGPVLKDRIIDQCFDGTLESISNSRDVQGIGEQKYIAICEWVKAMKVKMTQLLLEDFQGKAEILKKYVDLEGGVAQDLKVNALELQNLKRLRGEAIAAIDGLGPVDPSTFLAAYKGNSRAAEKVSQYVVGVYPEWGKMPGWFKQILEMNKTV